MQKLCIFFGLFHSLLESTEFWNFGFKKRWAAESKILGTQQRFYTVVSPNLRNICSFLKVNLYTVYISRRVRFHSSISFLCVCVRIIYCIRNQCGFYSRFLFPPGVAYPLEIKLAHFPIKSCVNENNSRSVSMWYSPLCAKLGAAWAMQKIKYLLETREGIFLVLGSCRTSRAHQPIDYPFSLLCFLS